MSTNTANVSVKKRAELGSRANKRLRDAGMLPGVVYGHKQDVIPVTLPKKEVVGHLNKGTHVFTLSIDGATENCLVKEVQYDYLGIEVLHVDFARVDLNERVEVTVPVELKGTPKGEADGGKLQQMMTDIEIECLVTEIPDAIRHNVSDMGMDAILHIRDLVLPAGVKALQDEDQIIAMVREPIVQDETPATEEGTAEPEVIGKKEKEEAEAAEAAAKKK